MTNTDNRKACYIFSAASQTQESAPRPAKRRKVSTNKNAGHEEQRKVNNVEFTSLLNGTEDTKLVNARCHLYEETWRRTDEHIQV